LIGVMVGMRLPDLTGLETSSRCWGDCARGRGHSYRGRGNYRGRAN